MPIQSVTSDPVIAPVDPFAVGHLGELTQVVSYDLVDAAISAAGATQKRLRRLPTRVVVYVLLAGVLFADVGYRQVLARLAAGAGLSMRVPGSSALSQAFRRIGVRPLAELFDLVRGPAAGAARWRGLRTAVNAITKTVASSWRRPRRPRGSACVDSTSHTCTGKRLSQCQRGRSQGRCR